MQTVEHEANDTYYPTQVGIAPEIQVETIEILNQTLANTLDLWMQVKCSHWNVKGMQFYALHQLFDTIAEELNSFIDLVAERVTALGGVALGAAQVVVNGSKLDPYPSNLKTGEAHIRAISDRMGTYAKSVRYCIELADGLGDADTADLYTEISRSVDKSLWLLEAHLQA